MIYIYDLLEHVGKPWIHFFLNTKAYSQEENKPISWIRYGN